MKKLLTRDQILGVSKLRQERVPVPEWGGDVIVRELTGTERDEYESSVVTVVGMTAKVNSNNMRARLVSMSCVDGEGKPLFTMADAEELGKKSAAALDRIVTVARRMSKIGEEELEALGEGSAAIRAVASTSI